MDWAAQPEEGYREHEGIVLNDKRGREMCSLCSFWIGKKRALRCSSKVKQKEKLLNGEAWEQVAWEGCGSPAQKDSKSALDIHQILP